MSELCRDDDCVRRDFWRELIKSVDADDRKREAEEDARRAHQLDYEAFTIDSAA